MSGDLYPLLDCVPAQRINCVAQHRARHGLCRCDDFLTSDHKPVRASYTVQPIVNVPNVEAYDVATRPVAVFAQLSCANLTALDTALQGMCCGTRTVYTRGTVGAL